MKNAILLTLPLTSPLLNDRDRWILILAGILFTKLILVTFPFLFLGCAGMSVFQEGEMSLWEMGLYSLC